MANRNHLAPKSITDKNGKRTTVYTANGAVSSSPEVAAKLKKRQEANVAAAAARAAGPAYQAPEDDGLGAAADTAWSKIGAEFTAERIEIATQGTAYLSASRVFNTVRGGGIGASAWVARLTGTDPTYGFEREFLDADKNLSRSSASGNMSWDIPSDGFYEYRSFAGSSKHPVSGYFVVANGRVADLKNRKVAISKALDALNETARASQRDSASVIQLVSRGIPQSVIRKGDVDSELLTSLTAL